MFAVRTSGAPLPPEAPRLLVLLVFRFFFHPFYFLHLPQSSASAKKQPSAFARLVLAVANVALAFGLHHAVARRAGRHYFVCYKAAPEAPYLIHTEASRNPRAALYQFEKAAMHHLLQAS